MHVQQLSFSGPLPPPNILKQYNEALPNGAERVMVMAENQSKHRQGMESKVIDADIKARKRGQNYAFILASLFILAGSGLVFLGKNIEGFSMIGIAAGTLGAAFIVGKTQQKQERIEKYKGRVPHSAK
jgi:uncharacterized membrane protein